MPEVVEWTSSLPQGFRGPEGSGDVCLGSLGSFFWRAAEDQVAEEGAREGATGAVGGSGEDAFAGDPKRLTCGGEEEEVVGRIEVAAGDEDVQSAATELLESCCGRGDLVAVWNGFTEEGGQLLAVGCDDGYVWKQMFAEVWEGVGREEVAAGAGAEHGVENDGKRWMGDAELGEELGDGGNDVGVAQHADLDAGDREVTIEGAEGLADGVGGDGRCAVDADGVLDGVGGDAGCAEEAVGSEDEQVRRDAGAGGGVVAGDGEDGLHGAVGSGSWGGVSAGYEASGLLRSFRIGHGRCVLPREVWRGWVNLLSGGGRTEAAERLVVALDFASAEEALAMVDLLAGRCRWFKVGMELFYGAAGSGVVEELCRRGFSVFLDLKLLDIPNTVAGAVRSLASTGASLLTVHASGGQAMLEAAAGAAANLREAPKLLGVTVLTSMDEGQMRGVGVAGSAAEQVLRLGRLASGAGLEGLVCSAEETRMLRAELGEEPMLVVPGIRAVETERGDQRRVATAREAIGRGASMLVVGRPITRAADPAGAAELILGEMAAALPQWN